MKITKNTSCLTTCIGPEVAC